MKEVRITLSDDQVAAIEAEIAAGEARSVSELVELALDAYLDAAATCRAGEQMLAGRGRGGGRAAAARQALHRRRCSTSSAGRCASDARRLEFTAAANRDIARRPRYLADVRGEASPSASPSLQLWLESLPQRRAARHGARDDPAVRDLRLRKSGDDPRPLRARKADRHARLLHGTGLVARAGTSLTRDARPIASMIAKPFGCSVSALAAGARRPAPAPPRRRRSGGPACVSGDRLKTQSTVPPRVKARTGSSTSKNARAPGARAPRCRGAAAASSGRTRAPSPRCPSLAGDVRAPACAALTGSQGRAGREAGVRRRPRPRPSACGSRRGP